MEKTQINPWTWQDQFRFSQAWRVDGAGLVVFISGQIPLDADGGLVGEGDFEAQTRQVFENLGAVLEAAGGSFDSVVKLTVFVTDVAKLPDFRRVKEEFIPGPQPASTALGVAALAFPALQIELEATAVLA